MRGDKRVHDGMNDRHPVGSACSTAIVRATSLGQTVASDARLDSSSIAAAFAAGSSSFIAAMYCSRIEA